MRERICHWLGWTLAVIATWATSVAAWGQEGYAPPAATGEYVALVPPQPAGDARTVEEIRARLEQQQQQIANLQEQLRSVQQGAQVMPVADTQVQGDAAKKPEDAKKADDGYVIGSGDLTLKGGLKDGFFPWFETPNKDFTMHLGLWTQFDNVWWDQPAALRTKPGARPGAAQGVATGVAAGGIGDLEDGCYFRRIRPNIEGTFWELGEYRFIPAIENNQFSTSGLDEVWVGARGVPAVDTVRVGHVKNCFGIEGDTSASSRCMTFMERSTYSEAIELNQNFVTGAWFSNNYFDQRMTWSAVVFRPDQGSSSGAFFQDGQMGVQARLTCLPVYEDDGRHLLHMGISGGWRNASGNLANTFPGNTVELRARPEMRDDDPAGSPSGGQAVPNANSNRMIDTGVIAANNEFLMGLETLYIRGPFSLQAEYGWNWVDNAIGVVQSSTSPLTAFATAQNYVFNGGYIQLAYTLTGENRGYDKRGGTLSREYFGKRGPFSNAWITKDANGNLISSWGAWEVAGRYSYVNLNDGFGINRIQGGAMNGTTLALNWYLNPNVTIDLDWDYQNRYDVPVGTIAGYTDGYGARVQFQF